MKKYIDAKIRLCPKCKQNVNKCNCKNNNETKNELNQNIKQNNEK